MQQHTNARDIISHSHWHRDDHVPPPPPADAPASADAECAPSLGRSRTTCAGTIRATRWLAAAATCATSERPVLAAGAAFGFLVEGFIDAAASRTACTGSSMRCSAAQFARSWATGMKSEGHTAREWGVQWGVQWGKGAPAARRQLACQHHSSRCNQTFPPRWQPHSWLTCKSQVTESSARIQTRILRDCRGKHNQNANSASLLSSPPPPPSRTTTSPDSP
jgi:hypothetical protein